MSECSSADNPFDWARPIIRKAQTFRQRTRYWHTVTVAFALLIFAGSYYMFGNWLLSSVAVVVLGALSLVVKDELLEYPTITSKQDTYVLLLVKMYDLADDVRKSKARIPLNEFDDAVSGLVRRQINPDIESTETKLRRPHLGL